MLILIFKIDVQDLEKKFFNFEKVLANQNHSSSVSHLPKKNFHQLLVWSSLRFTQLLVQ